MSDTVTPSSKSNLHELENDQSGVEKQIKISGYPQPEHEAFGLQKKRQ